jgi:hypothetical protein
MKNPNTKKKFRVVLIAAIFGAVVFAGGCIAFLISNHVSGHDTDAFVGPGIVLSIPSLIAAHIIGLQNSAFAQTPAFGVIINGLLGAFLFAVPIAFWQFVMKGGNESKN